MGFFLPSGETNHVAGGPSIDQDDARVRTSADEEATSERHALRRACQKQDPANGIRRHGYTQTDSPLFQPVRGVAKGYSRYGAHEEHSDGEELRVQSRIAKYLKNNQKKDEQAGEVDLDGGQNGDCKSA